MKDCTMTAKKANILSFIFVIPIAILCFVPLRLIWGYTPKPDLSLLLIFFIFFVSIFIHEGIHGAFFILMKGDRKNVKFGFIASQLTPYCSCHEVFKVWQYFIICMAPTFFLGIIPYIIALYTGSEYIMLFAFLSILGGSGDMLISFKMIGLKPTDRIKDHDSKVGFMLLEEGD